MRLMIIDDDLQIREGIREGIDWESLEVTEVRSYGNALKALKDLKEFSPDIILSDVRMPGMDGLEFLEKVKRSHPQVKVIMISAYSDFEYLKKALEHGAQDYELKPLKFKKLISIMHKTVKLIKQERFESAQHEEHLRQYRKIQLRKVLLGFEPMKNEVFTYFNTLITRSDDHTYLLLTIRIDSSQELDFNKIEDQILPEFKSMLRFHLYLESEKQLVMILRVENSRVSRMERQVRDGLKLLNERLCSEDIRISGGLSKLFSIEDIPVAYKHSCRLLQHTSYLGPGGLMMKQDLESSVGSHPSEWVVLQDSIVESFIHYDREQMLESLSLLGKWFVTHHETDQSIYRKSIIDCEVMIMHRKGMSSLFDVNRTTKALKELYYLEDIIEYAKRLFLAVLEAEVEKERAQLSIMTIQALDFIHKHYRENISAGDVATAINKTPNYFSSVFKKDLAVSFKEYVNRLRIKEAERLIREGNIYIYEVADQVGFSDYTYFYQVFKKVTGYEPTKLKKG